MWDDEPQGREATALGRASEPVPGAVKLLVWDLDDTLWRGTLAEGDPVVPRPEAVAALRTLDRRGILHSIASKNDYDKAMETLRGFGLDDLFLYPQISWSAKSASVERIARSINIGLDAVAFIDDQPFERDEVRSALPEVVVYSAAEVDALADRPELRPRFITADSAIRRQLYRSDLERKRVEEEFTGPKEEFLASLGMVLDLLPAREEDLRRAEELTVRTHQLNTTGITFSYEELVEIASSPDFLLLVARLADRYGTYGTIGLALVDKRRGLWTIKLLLMSCRVMSRGVGSVLVTHLMQQAAASSARLQAELRPNDRNRRMLVTFRFAGFQQVGASPDGALLLEADLERAQGFPDYIEVRVTSQSNRSIRPSEAEKGLPE